VKVDTSIREHLAEKLSNFFNTGVSILDVESRSGGDINEAFLLNTTSGKFFMKMNSNLPMSDLFEKESLGLQILAEANTLKIPAPLFHGKFQGIDFLLMEYIESGRPLKNFWEDFGSAMAKLHRTVQLYFGLPYDNYIGSLSQSNRQHPDWFGFYSQERILVLAIKAFDRNLLDNSHIRYAEQLCQKIRNIVPMESPSLLHGDLWNGNFMVSASGKAAIFDPAVYYGHREMDLAMTKLFGGFDHEFYHSYGENFSIAPGWQKRIDIFQLYPLLVHLLLFGGHYRESVTEILTKYN
jgi:fructosamine-3-kinase